eukprot:CAMPEP_0170480620 /NCGR_PEP_ID=MMETSP0208-20121228/1390_1 /TAXON_ID=197538 /ORGANISM="Strombidium inclinatum, Strain S3" /LENGTH=68 /DNA_ID=CAMNT_0010753201 /DNA_START=939 /DNA_END=1146 /DNA_ORIENTATION=+
MDAANCLILAKGSLGAGGCGGGTLSKVWPREDGSGSQGATTAAVNAAAVGSAVGGGGTARAVDAGRAV